MTEHRIHHLARLALTSGDHVLLCKTHKSNGEAFYFLPGGHTEEGESVVQAIEREVCREEAHVEANRLGRLFALGVLEHCWDQKGKPYHEINIVLGSEWIGERAPILSREAHLSFEWVPLAEMGNINLLPLPMRTLLPQWLEAPRVPFFKTTMVRSDDLVKPAFHHCV